MIIVILTGIDGQSRIVEQRYSFDSVQGGRSFPIPNVSFDSINKVLINYQKGSAVEVDGFYEESESK